MKRISIIGCGDISGIYLKNLTGIFNDRIEIAGVYDLIREKAAQRAGQYNISKIYGSLDELLCDESADMVLNLTRPYEHFAVSEKALSANKHVYSEKPLAASFEDGLALDGLAKKMKLLIGGAPDTFLGAGLQTCRKLIDDGVIGDIVGASAFMVCRGHESWHPDPEFYYKNGGGPMMDMGPYYLTALVSLLGSIKTVTAMTKTSFPSRTITSAPKNGTIIDVEVPTYITGIMEFANGAVGTIFTTFDVHAAQVPRIEIYGSKGTLSAPDPNFFDGPVLLYRPEDGAFKEMPLLPGYKENSRGLGLYDMAGHIEDGTPFRASGTMTLHVLEVMESFGRAYRERGFIDLKTTVTRPEPLGTPVMS